MRLGRHAFPFAAPTPSCRYIAPMSQFPPPGYPPQPPPMGSVPPYIPGMGPMPPPGGPGAVPPYIPGFGQTPLAGQPLVPPPPPLGNYAGLPPGAPPTAVPVHQHPVVFAGFWIRVLGYLIDNILIVACECAVILIIFLIAGTGWFPYTSRGVPTVGAYGLDILGALVIFAYFTLTVKTGASVGQRFVALRVVDAQTGAPLMTTQAMKRAAFMSFVGLIPIAGGLVILIGYLAVTWDPWHQGWHDKLGHAVVIERAPQMMAPPWGQY